ncbi:MAG: sulfatase [Kiritimatiellales bacterium]
MNFPATDAEIPQMQTPPNIVLILTDDMGYSDISAFGAVGWKTPNIDRLAAEGIQFTNFHVTSGVCSASRASILTGRYHNRMGIDGALMPWDEIGLPESEKTIAGILKTAGYATGMVGKWHLGSRPEQLPLHHGFDEWLGLPYSNDMWPVEFDGTPTRENSGAGKWPPLPLYDGGAPVEIISTLEQQDMLTTRYTERALDFIDRNHNAPFFLYFAHSMPHVPLGVSEKFKGKSEQGLYGDVMMEIDWSVGEIIKKLKEHQLEENTLVIFTSDNGPWLSFGNHAGTCHGLRGGKGTAWEGGIRVPAIMRRPGAIPAGTVCNELVSSMELLPTIIAQAGAPAPEKPLDGFDISALLAGTNPASPRKNLYYYYKPNELRAVIQDQWKLIFPHAYRDYTSVPAGSDGYCSYPTDSRTGKALYDIIVDPGEQIDRRTEFPAVESEIDRPAEKARNELGDNLLK